MNNLYIDQHSGVSGDMLNAALLNMFDNFNLLMERLNLLNLDGFRIEYKSEKRNHINGGRFIVHRDENPRSSRNLNRNFNDIKTIILNSNLSEDEKRLSLRIFTRIAKAESIVHGVDIENVHFHEVGAIDSIIDIVGFSILFLSLHIKKVFASPFFLGNGTTTSQHGEIPVPAPATVELLKGYPVFGTDKNKELTTPTGAAIVTSIADEFGALPGSIIKKVGTGFGSRSDSFNAVRVFLLDEYKETRPYNEETVLVIETTIDDSTSEEIAFLQELLFANGALDVFVTPVVMKKSRSGFNVTAVSDPQMLNNLTEIIFKNSSTFGIRYGYFLRKSIERKIINVNSRYGTIPVKIGYYDNNRVKYSPEYDVCSKISRETGVTLKDIYEDAINIARKTIEK